MKLTGLKITISLICSGLIIAHLLAPTIKIDPVTLGLLVIGMLPWFQPLLKSLELPGGLKIELQDIKAITDKISGALPSEGQNEARVRPQEEALLSFINQVAEQDPNLALVGLRIEIEKRLNEIAEEAGLATGKQSINQLVTELSRREIIPRTVGAGLREFIALGNQAAHGASVSQDAAAWVLAIAPQFLGALTALRLSSPKIQNLEEEVPKAQVRHAYQHKSSITVSFERPFGTRPNVTAGFYDYFNQEISGSLEIQEVTESGFKLRVASLPDSESVTNWKCKWKARGLSN